MGQHDTGGVEGERADLERREKRGGRTEEGNAGKPRGGPHPLMIGADIWYWLNGFSYPFGMCESIDGGDSGHENL